MRFSLVLLALSALAAAGPLPSFSNSALEARNTSSTPANITLTIDPAAALTELKTLYDSLITPEPNGALILKRDFWAWLKDAFEAPGLKARSPVSTSISNSDTLDSDPAAILAKLKAVYDNLNEKRMESGVLAKRGFWDWLKDMFGAPGLKARSLDDHSLIESNPHEALKTKRTCEGVSDSESLMLPREDSHGQQLKRVEGQWDFLTRRCDASTKAGS